MKRPLLLFIALSLLTAGHPVWLIKNETSRAQTRKSETDYDVRAFGAKGDGQTLDTAAINRAIETAAANGGGTVRFPAGSY
jgi:polygalacturonase